MTGIELPGESRGIVRSPETWNGDSLASMSIGYEIGVTALQSASAFAAIANDGVRVRPHIIKEIRQAGGGVISATEVEKTRIVSSETARSLRQMMQKVVLNGTGKRAQLNGYSSAGKTGTAWKYDAKLKKINENKYVSSFIGFASVDNPSVVIAVILDEPQVATRDGGHVAAPVFRKIAEQILPELNVVPDGTIRQEIAVDIIEGKEVKPGESEKTANKRTNDLAENENRKPPSDIRITKERRLPSENEPIARPKSVLPDAKPKSDSKNKLTEKEKI